MLDMPLRPGTAGTRALYGGKCLRTGKILVVDDNHDICPRTLLEIHTLARTNVPLYVISSGSTMRLIGTLKVRASGVGATRVCC